MERIFMKEGGYTPDTPFASPHPSLTRDQAAQILMRKKFNLFLTKGEKNG